MNARSSSLPAMVENAGDGTVDCVVGRSIQAVAGVVSVLNTFTLTGADVVKLRAESLATAVSVCAPFAARFEFQLMLYGLVVSSAPRAAPSILNWTPAMPRLSLAVADTVT